MTRLIYRLPAVIFALLAIVAADAAQVSFHGADDLTSNRVEDNYVLSMQLNPRVIKPGRDREMIITPVLTSADGKDSIVMPTVYVSGRNRYFSHIRNNDLPAGVTLLQAGKDAPLDYRFETPWLPWMNHSDLNFRCQTGNCCDTPVNSGSPLIARHNFRPPYMEFDPMYVALTGDSTIVIEAQGSAFVDFVVNRTELKPDYRGNRKEIDKIIKSIDLVAQDSDAIITRITIKGYASPEGTYANNTRLALGRTKTLRDYVTSDISKRHASFNPEVMFTDYEPEDWDGLIKWLENNQIENGAAILEIARDKSLEPDPRNSKIQRLYPRQYAYLLKEVYPALRHSDYTIRYNIKTTNDVEHLKQMMATTPERLRPVDFYMIARTYPLGSEEYIDVMMKAAKQYPNDPEAALNVANIYLAQNDLDKAEQYLASAGNSPEAIFTRANIAARRGDLKLAKSLLKGAGEKGMPQAAELIEQIDALLNFPVVTYF
ncbi:MAG: tetratricopeptide repeat protein [Muribaculaceae bacterium]|nr:tetratricopeptide repeat protein [Muribaculaceae bacterium]